MISKHQHTFILSIDETAKIVREGRTVIAVCANQVIRSGSPQDIQREIEVREELPPNLRSWSPEILEIIRGDDLWALCESKHALSEAPVACLENWDEVRKDQWRQEPWQGSLEAAFRLIRPHRPLDYKKWSQSLKRLKNSGVSVPIPVQASKIRQICRREREITWHRGWVHGALLSNRIRASVFLCWRNAKSDGLRGEDLAGWVTPGVGTDPDILLHVIKAVWHTDPLRAAQALNCLRTSESTPKRCFVSVSAHSGVSPSVVEHVIGCSTGEQASWKAARALYRARNLLIGGVPIRVHTQPEIQAKRDDAFFIQRKRRLQDLFSLYERGVQLDEEGRCSLTPERHAMTIAGYFQSFSRILDACCGCGGNAIAFARTDLRVVALDTHRERLAMARHNARIYGVEDKIIFLNESFPNHVGDTDAVFLDPPWSLPELEIKSWWDRAETSYSHGMIKLPKDFPVPEERTLRVFCTQEGYPSFVLVGWGKLAKII